MDKKRIVVIDGQGGGVGKALIEKIRLAFGDRVHILALGANALATTAMLKAGADAGATGENAVLVNIGRANVDVVLGSLGIIAADAMLGEITPVMARVIGQCEAVKLLIPVNKCQLKVVGVKESTFADYIAEAVEALRSYLLPVR